MRRRQQRGRVRAESRARYYVRKEAERRGWNVAHLDRAGNVLEEQEIVAHFQDIGLGLDRPDFLFCIGGEPVLVVETKNEAGRIREAVEQGIEYANTINLTDRYEVRLVVGVAGTEDTGFIVETRYLLVPGNQWVLLTSHGAEITTLPSAREVEVALNTANGTTQISIPTSPEFIDAALEISAILRASKVEAPLRPKVIGAIVLAMYRGEIDTSPQSALNSINALVQEAVHQEMSFSDEKEARLLDALRLSGNDFDRLSSSINRVVAILRRLNVRSVLQLDIDFLGMFYEAFLRYGYDNNSLGIVFTPRHITRYCTEIVDVKPIDSAIDIACGTGGFLVAAFERMIKAARSPASIEQVKASLYGFDTNPTVWALVTLNMFFRGDGKSHIEYGSCFDERNRTAVRRRFTRAFLNPPFSQQDEPERDFIDAAMETLSPEGLLAAVVYAGIFADDEHKKWRRQFLRQHSLVAMISLPEDLFYPTSAPTSILIARAHVPQPADEQVMMARVWNDGYLKLKNQRVQREGNQLPEIAAAYTALVQGRESDSELTLCIRGRELSDGNEWSPQEWLPQPTPSINERNGFIRDSAKSIYQAVAQYPDLADSVLDDFCSCWDDLPSLPLDTHLPVGEFFEILNGKSTGEKNYSDGGYAYVSSGEASNSIVRLVSDVEGEVFTNGGITVTAFGAAAVQPWPFLARGNGGSSVRILQPKFRMSYQELLWFAAQINVQRWRFFYARQSIKSRLERLVIGSPLVRQQDQDGTISDNVRTFRENLMSFSRSSY